MDKAELDTNNQTIKIAQAIPDKANQKKGRNQALAYQKKGNNNKNLENPTKMLKVWDLGFINNYNYKNNSPA